MWHFLSRVLRGCFLLTGMAFLALSWSETLRTALRIDPAANAANVVATMLLAGAWYAIGTKRHLLRALAAANVRRNVEARMKRRK